MSLIHIILIVLLILVVLGLPQWPYATNYGWGYYPSGALGLILIILLVLLLAGRL